MTRPTSRPAADVVGDLVHSLHPELEACRMVLTAEANVEVDPTALDALDELRAELASR